MSNCLDFGGPVTPGEEEGVLTTKSGNDNSVYTPSLLHIGCAQPLFGVQQPNELPVVNFKNEHLIQYT